MDSDTIVGITSGKWWLSLIPLSVGLSARYGRKLLLWLNAVGQLVQAQEEIERLNAVAGHLNDTISNQQAQIDWMQTRYESLYRSTSTQSSGSLPESPDARLNQQRPR